jgi:E3 ubiquitin-protein ligase XIAP
MNSEEARLATFHTWTKAFISKEKLALYGFYHCGPDDNVKCAFCKVEIGSWEVGDNVLREHLRWSPNCPLIKRKRTANQPINEENFDRSLPPVSVDTVGIYFPIEHRPNSYPENEFMESQPISSSTVNHPDYRKHSDRLKSFEEWPKSMRQKPAELSEAGFFYLGKGDQVKCFSCGGGLKDWEEDDVPWEQHAMWYEKCPYLNEAKTANYILSVKQKYETKESSENTNNSTNVQVQSNSDAQTTTILNEDTSISDSKLCKICCDKEMNAILFPCMHIVACVPCAFSLDSCPVCRKPISEVKRIYFS